MRLSRDVLAHLRAVAEGVPVLDAATTYLVDDGRSAAAAHDAAVQAAGLVARRAGMGSRWRLLRVPTQAVLPSPVAEISAPPSLEEWASAEGLDDWSVGELQAIYAERFGFHAEADRHQVRKRAQIERLRLGRLALLRELEAFAVDPPALSDPVDGWFDAALSQRLAAAGFRTLQDLQRAIASGGRWWRGIPAYGATKACRLAADVQALVGLPPAPDWARAQLGPQLSGFAGTNRGHHQVIAAQDDHAAINAWIELATQSPATARAYRREAERFLLWLLIERGRALSDAGPEDCRAYMDFLAKVPQTWMSRRYATRLGPGWAPFSTQPGVASQRYALTVLRSLFSRLVLVGYLRLNPWAAVNTRIADPRGAVPRSRAFTPRAWQALMDHVHVLPPAAAARMRWLLVFTQATGLRAEELLKARCSDLFEQDGGWWIRVHGKGARNRDVVMPSAAVMATRDYLRSRTGADLHQLDPRTPLITGLAVAGNDASHRSTGASDELVDFRSLSYSSLAQAFKRFSRSAFIAAGFFGDDLAKAERASLHWLRHTHATRAVEHGVPQDVLQMNLGQADPRTTALYYRAQERRRMAALESAFGETPERS